MTRSYYSVIVKDSKSSPWAVEFGDYDKEVAESERDNLKESGKYVAVKIIKTASNQAAINAAVTALNA
jgi:cAMP phosphodiesterase